jgi:protein SCO1/2
MRVASVVRSLRLPLLAAGLALGLLAGCSAQSRMDFYSKDIACEELAQHCTIPNTAATILDPKDIQGRVTNVYYA